ncbi:MAG: gluconokinase [Acetobacteraceae bacterium]|nr:gluconokinase [Acetobacteraceae bacterium]
MQPPSVLVVMGVSGSGKTTVAALLAGRLGWELGDADDWHSPASVRKMHGGTPLSDEDRWPWLRSIAAWIDATRVTGQHAVLACSALKRAYRDILIGDRADVRLVYLRGEEQLIERRQGARLNHYMPASLVHSQFEALEVPGQDEHPLVVDVVPPAREIVGKIIGFL